RHYDLGEQAPQAAQYYFLVAQSSFTSGAFKEAAQLCRRALDCIHRSRERNVDQDRITVQAVLLLLTAMDTNRQGKANEDESFSLEKLAQEGVEAAARTGDKDMLAQAQFALGRVFVATRSLSSVIEALEAALKTARESDDRQIEFAILAQLGIMVKAQSFDKGQQLVQEALKIYQDHLAPSPGQKAPLALERHFLRMQAFLGIGEFDHGNLDEAERWLAQSVAGMSRLGLNDDLLFTYNYLAQVYAGMGQFEAAEKSLQDAVRFLKDDPEPNPWRAYDSSFLGKLYLEWNRVEQAAKPILEGWKETNAKWNVDLARFPRIYYAELLIHPEYSGCDLKEARLQLEKAIEENISAGYRDMEIQARSLLARLELRSGNIARAENLSLEAVQILEKEGPWFPALRPEEVYYVHSLVMDRAGKHDEASQALEKAKAYVLGKAATLANPVHRQTFLERIPLNTAILLASP
ncbi:MAG TPA: tetratricopeptide repeat protein, partial [Anaerolineales bacterium]